MQPLTNLQLIGYLISSIIFVAIGIFMLDDMMIMGWITILFFGLGIPIFGFQLLKRLFPALSKKPAPLEFPSEIIIQQVVPMDDKVLEEWRRKCSDIHQQFHGVSAIKTSGSKFQWQVFFSAGEFIREEPYQAQLAEMIYDAIEGIEGVKETGREDTEVFVVDGSPGGEELIQRVSTAIDEFMLANLQKWLDKT